MPRLVLLWNSSRRIKVSIFAKFKHYLVVSSRVGVISSSDVSTLVLRNVPAEEYTAQSNVSFLFEHWFLHYHQIIRLTFRK